MAQSRNIAVDITRGLAIFIMVPANMAALYAEPHAFWFRVVSSFAAPIFIGVAGMMIAQGTAARDRGWIYYLTRGALVLAMAALVDLLIFRAIPFKSFDVLYVIGIACPLTYFFTRVSRVWQWVLIALIFLATPLLQWTFGYADHPGEYRLFGDGGSEGIVPKNPTGMLQHLLIDGWFPVFPWLGMSFAGAAIARTFFEPAGEAAYREMALAGTALLIVGTVLWWLYPGPAYDRGGYSELFYPPTVGFMLTACGVLMVLLWTFHWDSEWIGFAPLRWLGECALLMYVLHLAIISYVLVPWISEQPLSAVLAMSLAILFVLAIVAVAVRQLKAVWPDRPYLARFLLG